MKKSNNSLIIHSKYMAQNLNNNDVLFIIGATKTASSTLLGMLNCHPGIFLFYETDLYLSQPSKYSLRFLETYPDARYFMGYFEDIGEPYRLAKQYFKNKGFDYQIVGDKIHGLDNNFARLKNYPVIFIIRDLRTWLCKEAVVTAYANKKNLIPAAVDYAAYYLESFLLPRALRLRMEDIMKDNAGVIKKLENFLGLELNLGKWWEKIDQQGMPKDAQRWWEGHASSLVEPKQLDVNSELKPQAFWDAILPIFDKYYLNAEKNFSSEEIASDVAELKKLKNSPPISLTDAYQNYWSTAIIPAEKKLTAKARIKRLIRKVADKLYYEAIKLLR